ncbi:MAG: DegT/DnrJ/EryC1/StrS family aminotransferase [Candidatus Hydrogenedentes bacterium]|nr:DegT/DnrJ/EryC1/StrS family aminotransferase [Candidatus Hydrogenedentota bacterium]
MSKLAILGGKPIRSSKEKLATWPISDKKDAELVKKITLSNRWSFDGEYEWKFAEAFTKYQGAKYGLCVANGTVAIQLALEALDIGAYDEVIVPGMTWQATAAACIDVNAIPILVDVEPDTWNLDLDKVEACITPKTKAIIVVHLYGSMADLDRLQKICKKYNLYLIEDCAHQHGSFWRGKGVGSIGDVSAWSFQESKVLSSGEGGFNMCKTKEIFYKLYSLRNCGRPYPANPPVFGLKKPVGMEMTLQSGNYRLTEWQAAILLGGLSRLDEQVKLRDANAQYLNSLLAQIPGIKPMRRRPQVTQQSYFNFAFRIDPDELKVTNAQFCAALNAELSCGDAFEPPYEPLNACGLYKPLTKKRYKISEEYWKAIDPKRFNLPVCTDAHTRSGIVVHHVMLMNSRKVMNQVAEAVKKVVDNISEVRKIKAFGGRRYRPLAI